MAEMLITPGPPFLFPEGEVTVTWFAKGYSVIRIDPNSFIGPGVKMGALNLNHAC
jgi:hypothetical protein